jgi:hypothetical protein
MKRNYLKITILFIILTVVAMSYFPKSELALPTYVIYFSENKSSEVKKQKIERLIEFDSEEDKSEILSEGNNQVITTTTFLLDRIRIALKKCNLTECNIEHQFYAISEPSIQNKKILRREIEINFTGRERYTALSSIIIIIGLGNFNPNISCRENIQSMKHELDYIKYNFGGVAFISDTIPLCSRIIRLALSD